MYPRFFDGVAKLSIFPVFTMEMGHCIRSTPKMAKNKEAII